MVYLDEIGVLEIMGNGFSYILKRLIKEKVDITIVVRDELIENVVKQFNIKE